MGTGHHGTAVALAVTAVLAVTAAAAAGCGRAADPGDRASTSASAGSAGGPSTDPSAGDPAGSPGSPPAPTGSAGAAQSPGLSGTDLPTMRRPSGPPKGPNDAYTVITVQGVVRISGGCTLLSTDAALWTLIGWTGTAAVDGGRYEVTGLPSPQQETTCSGGPLHVRSAKRL